MEEKAKINPISNRKNWNSSREGGKGTPFTKNPRREKKVRLRLGGFG